MVEGDDSSLDTAMFVDQENGQKVLVPVRLDAPLTSASASGAVDLGTGSATYDEQNHVDMDADTDPPPSRPQTKDCWFYMKEFVARADGILQAMQAKEALQDNTQCAECADSPAKWRCEDCVGGRVLCRKCMRHSHSQYFSLPHIVQLDSTGLSISGVTLIELDSFSDGVRQTRAHP